MAQSEHFSDHELACKCCGRNETTQALVDVLESFRHHAGNVPVIVHDAYRCPDHNAKVGGVPHSQHMEGNAADISIPGKTAAELEWIARSVPGLHGIGRDDYKNYIHIDVRAGMSSWCYGPDGHVISYYYPKQAAV